jgi:hypothetical protein
MKVTRITADHAYTDEPICANRDETKVVSETDKECDHLVTNGKRLFPFEKAIKLGLLKADDPINTEAAIEHASKPEGKKVIEGPDETKVIELGTAKNSKK